MHDPKHYAIIYSPGEQWAEGRTIYQQDLRGHGEYMQSLLDDGRLMHGGPFSDSSGGMAIVRAASMEEAQRMVDNDPAVQSGVFSASLRPWQMVFGG